MEANPDKWVSFKTLSQHFELDRATLKGWEKQKRFSVVRMPGGKRLYRINDIRKLLGHPVVDDQKEKISILYARVSSTHQKEDLRRQIEFLQQHYPKHIVYSDIGSGLNWKRPKFTALLEAIHSNTVQQLVVLHKDRLCRFGFELLEWLCQKHNTKLVVHSRCVHASASNQLCTSFQSPHEELADDLLAVVNVFVACANGRRAGENRKRRREEEQQQLNHEPSKRIRFTSQENTIESNPAPETNTP
jgi:putative resolvase